jgi:hypothetical protein
VEPKGDRSVNPRNYQDAVSHYLPVYRHRILNCTKAQGYVNIRDVTRPLILLELNNLWENNTQQTKQTNSVALSPRANYTD